MLLKTTAEVVGYGEGILCEHLLGCRNYLPVAAEESGMK